MRQKEQSEVSDDSFESRVRDGQKTKKRRRRRQNKSRKRGAPQQQDLMEGLPDEQEVTRKLMVTSTRRGYRQTPLSQRQRENADILRMAEINRRREKAKHTMKRLRERMQKLRGEQRVVGHPREETGDDEDSMDRVQKKSRRNKDNVLPLPLRGHADTKQYGQRSRERSRRPLGIKRVESLVLPRRMKRCRSGSQSQGPSRKKRKRAEDDDNIEFRRLPSKKCASEQDRYGREEVDLRKRRQGQRNENVFKDPSRNVRKRDHRCRNRYPVVSTNIRSEKTVAKEDTRRLKSNITAMRTLRMTPRRLQQLKEISSSKKKREELKAIHVHGTPSSIDLEFIPPPETDNEATLRPCDDYRDICRPRHPSAKRKKMRK